MTSGEPPHRRWLAGVAGLVAILASGPAGNVQNLFCKIVLGSICGRAPYRNTDLGDRWLGRLVLLLGVCIVGWALGARRRSTSGSRVARVAYTLRWAPVVAGLAGLVVLGFARNPGAPTEFVVTALNVPAGYEVETMLRREMDSSCESWYRQSWDYTLRLPVGGFDPPILKSTGVESRFVVRGALTSMERWREDPTEIIVSAEKRDPKAGGYILIRLARRSGSDGPVEHRLRVKDARPCGNPDAREGYCYRTGELGYREGGGPVHFTLDFAGLE